MKFDDNQAIYLQVADYIADQILGEHWKTGDRIPSVREVAASVEVNPNTIMRSFAFLQEQKIIVNQRGVGYFVADTGIENARKWKREEFMQKLLPNFFHQAMALGIDEAEMIELYREFQTKVANKD